MPMLAIGTGKDFHAKERTPQKSPDATLVTALALGYTHVDAGEAYASSSAVGQVLMQHNRSSFFLTTKVDPTLTSKRVQQCAIGAQQSAKLPYQMRSTTTLHSWASGL